MKRMLVIGLVVLAIVILATSPVVKRWTGSQLEPLSKISAPLVTSSVAPISSRPAADPELRVKCDGRKYCRQMTSCAEATAFLKQCPGMEMDGDGDGIPCESQWCIN
jgi:hypothetical protein